MGNEWLHITGWANMLKPHLLLFWLALTFLYSVLVTKVALSMFSIPRHTYSVSTLSLCVSLISFCTFVVECVFIHIFANLMHYNDPQYGYVSAWDSYGLNIYENVDFLLFTIVSVVFCIYISYRLNTRFTLKRLRTSNLTSTKPMLLVSVLTSPIIFLFHWKRCLMLLFQLSGEKRIISAHTTPLPPNYILQSKTGPKAGC